MIVANEKEFPYLFIFSDGSFCRSSRVTADDFEKCEKYLLTIIDLDEGSFYEPDSNAWRPLPIGIE